MNFGDFTINGKLMTIAHLQCRSNLTHPGLPTHTNENADQSTTDPLLKWQTHTHSQTHTHIYIPITMANTFCTKSAHHQLLCPGRHSPQMIPPSGSPRLSMCGFTNFPCTESSKADRMLAAGYGSKKGFYSSCKSGQSGCLLCENI